ncbi:hypothetical protein CYLTODRAFT_162348 [Cylindrobasidium torrendii FP15055 ss-10]|uniref:Uncharacterized protein n=1 Tax=Cylindrobasidium torrendii FP15055 ss-10 TaxID=1314674 RepID=A0A0D7AY81_9AGAR|nr:hypothetical protein CYLTODRAFT_162348 [Cylindrobasidium torrendii FP15055 ss-10]
MRKSVVPGRHPAVLGRFLLCLALLPACQLHGRMVLLMFWTRLGVQRAWRQRPTLPFEFEGFKSGGSRIRKGYTYKAVELSCRPHPNLFPSLRPHSHALHCLLRYSPCSRSCGEDR